MNPAAPVGQVPGLPAARRRSLRTTPPPRAITEILGFSWVPSRSSRRPAPAAREVSPPKPQVFGFGSTIGEFCRLIHFTPDLRQKKLLEQGGRRVLLNCTRQWGKSTVTAAKAVWEALRQPASLILVLNPAARQSGEFLRKAAVFVRLLGIAPKGDGDNEISLAFPNGSRIVGLPGNQDTIRGFSAVRLLLIDEASRVPEELYLAVKPMLAVGDGDMWLMSTPNGKLGFFYDAWANGGSDWMRVMVPATECPRISAKFLEDEKRTMPDSHFRQEYLCEFTDNDRAVFSSADLDGIIDYDIKPLFPGKGL